MQPNVKKTVDDIEMMIQNWKKFWLGQYTEEGPNDWILDEFCQLILGGEYYQFGIVKPAIEGLLRQGFIDENEYKGIMERIYGEIDDMRRLLRLSEE